MKFGIIGTGVVGQTLGTGLAAKGHQVKIGSREPDSAKLQEWKQQTGANASTGTLTETVRFGEIIIVATHWEGTENALKLAGPQNFAGKIVIDATNPLKMGAKGPELAIGFDTSGGEKVQEWLPEAKVVKAFNIITARLMIDAKQLGDEPDMFIAGNDAEAKKAVSGILDDFGWGVIDLGGIEESRLLEPLGMIWIRHMFNTQNWQHAFKLVRK